MGAATGFRCLSPALLRLDDRKRPARAQMRHDTAQQPHHLFVLKGNHCGHRFAAIFAAQHKYNRYFGSNYQPQPNQEFGDRHNRKEAGRHRADHISISRHVFPARATNAGLPLAFV
jgi:hypothetical protein